MRVLLILFIALLQLQSIAQHITQVKLKDLEDGLNERIVNKIARDTFGYFYLFSNNSIQRYDGIGFENLVIPIGAENLLKEISEVTSDNKGGLKLKANNTNQALHISPASLTASYITIERNSDESNRKLVLSDNLAKYVIRGQDTIVASRGSFWKYVDSNLIQLGHNDIQGYNCNAITQDNYGNIIAAFGNSPNETDSIFVLRSSGEILDYSQALVYNDKIKDIYCDDINDKWMIATYNGLYIISYKRPGIEVYHSVDNISSSGFGYLVMGVSADGPDVLFVDENYGLRTIDSNGKVELLFPQETVDFFDNEMVVYDEITNQYYIVANYTDEETVLYITDTTYTQLRKQIIPFTVRDFLILNEEELLLVGENRAAADMNASGRLMKWNTATSKGQMIDSSKPNLRTVKRINDHYWIGTSNGLYRYNESLDSVLKLESDISNPYILCIKEVGDKVYIGTYGGGLYAIDKVSMKVVDHYDKSNFLSDNIVAALEVDNQDNIWVSTFNGINVIDKHGDIVSKIMEYDGISHREMNTNAISKDRLGNIYFGTLNGLTKLNPKEILNWSTSYGLHIESATAYYNKNGKVIDIHENPIPIEVGFDSLLISVAFPSYINSIFDTPLNYLKINDNAAKVLSHDNKQLLITSDDIDTDPIIRFTYEHNAATDALAFDPQFDYTQALITSLLLLCLIGIVLVIFYRQKIRKVEKEQDEKIAINKRIAELELSALQSQMNPHFIFNALGAIQYFIQTQKTEEADNFLADFAMLMRKILESSKTKYITLREEKEILDLYINLEKIRFEGLFDFSWHIDDNVDMDMIIPPMILQPFVENAINHGLFNLKNKQGQLDIFINQKSDQIIECIIRDNGIGRKQAATLRAKKHKPRGMQIVNDRITTLNSIDDIHVKVSTIDLYENNEPSGTTASIEIQYNILDF